VTATWLDNLLREFNVLRREVGAVDPCRNHLDHLAEAGFHATEHFITYGSLAPGGPNHHRVAELSGTWERGWVEGDLEPTGWGAQLGYPALRWRPGGPRIPAHLLRSATLREHWAALDRFEGPGYQRILVPFYNDAGLSAIGYVYAAFPAAVA
jgi:gamma-glutamylcyclotransferase (GGCT)/AIG2-like uncharacterized protein YtfP